MLQFIYDRGVGIAWGALAMAAQVSGFTNTAIALFFVAVAAFFFVAPVWHHARAWHKRRVAAGQKSLEPVHLLIGGLAGIILCSTIALGGVFWYFSKGAAGSQQSPAAIDEKSMSELKTQLADIQAQLANKPPQVTTPAPAPQQVDPATVLRRKYFGRSKELFDENLTQLSRVVNGRGSEAVKLADKLLPLFTVPPIIVQPATYDPFKSNLPQVIKILDEIHETIWGKILRENRDQVEDLNDVILDGGDQLTKFKNRMQQTTQMFSSFQVIFEKGDQQNSNNAAVLFSTLQAATQKDVATFNEWIEACNRRLDLKRKALENEK